MNHECFAETSFGVHRRLDFFFTFFRRFSCIRVSSSDSKVCFDLKTCQDRIFEEDTNQSLIGFDTYLKVVFEIN